MQEFPDFSKDVEDIIFFNNSLNTIYANETLPNILTHLDISACKLKSIHRGFLQSFSRLEYLDVSYNRELTLEALPNITYDLQFTNIKILKIEAIQCKYGKGLTFKRKYSQFWRNTTLEELHISKNRIETIERFVLRDIPDSLQRITIADNPLVFSWAVLDIPFLTNIKYIDLSNQHGIYNSFLSFVENTCNDSNPQVESEIQDSENTYPLKNTAEYSSKSLESCLSEFITIPPRGKLNVYICLPRSLETIIHSDSGVGDSRVPYVHRITYDMRHVHHLNLKGNGITELSYSNKLGKDTTFVNFSDNYISDIKSEFLRDANLSNLDLSANYLDRFFNKKGSDMLLKNQRFIQNISLAKNKIDKIPTGLFKDAINLQHIDLSFNNLENLKFIGQHLKRIQLLNMTGNNIQAMSKHEMGVLDSVTSSQLEIDLSENNILCTCDTLEFLKWVHSQNSGSRIMFTGLNSYRCTTKNSSRFSFSDLPYIISTLEKECSPYTGLIVGAAIVVAIASFTSIGGILYRNRWKIRYIYYMAKRGYKGSAHARGENHRNLFRYDAFISYADEDEDICFRNCVKEIEEKSGLKLCLHERDFIPGCSIAENIASAIRDSRRTVCVASNNYLRSHWCMYEFNMALMGEDPCSR